MSTNDVPGYNPSNRDALAMGCWAESADGSLLFVEGVENGRVIYSMFDSRHKPVLEYRDAMSETDFKTAFSWKADRSSLKDKASAVPSIQWTWHDKTPFPWDRVIQRGARDGSRLASAADTLEQAEKLMTSIGLSDAAKVASAVGAAGREFSSEMRADTIYKVGGLIQQLGERLQRMGKK